MGLSRYQWRKQSSALTRATETYGTEVRRIALEPLAPIPATKSGSLVKTGRSIRIKDSSQQSVLLRNHHKSKANCNFYGFDSLSLDSKRRCFLSVKRR